MYEIGEVGAKKECDFAAARDSFDRNAFGIDTGLCCEPLQRLLEILQGNVFQLSREPGLGEIAKRQGGNPVGRRKRWASAVTATGAAENKNSGPRGG